MFGDGGVVVGKNIPGTRTVVSLSPDDIVECKLRKLAYLTSHLLISPQFRSTAVDHPRPASAIHHYKQKHESSKRGGGYNRPYDDADNNEDDENEDENNDNEDDDEDEEDKEDEEDDDEDEEDEPEQPFEYDDDIVGGGGGYDD